MLEVNEMKVPRKIVDRTKIDRISQKIRELMSGWKDEEENGTNY